ncbi:hypothetical protein [Streptomyces sp. NPDC059943]|uniref:hypothetical protein n=1 Tax=Streptomyces sp. NPDC059943 TaxID=3347010 RepID=UPI003645F692
MTWRRSLGLLAVAVFWAGGLTGLVTAVTGTGYGYGYGYGWIGALNTPVSRHNWARAGAGSGRRGSPRRPPGPLVDRCRRIA